MDRVIKDNVLDEAVTAFLEYLDEDGMVPVVVKGPQGGYIIQVDQHYNLSIALRFALAAADAEKEKWAHAD